jgi:hypothetical protein
LPFCDEKTRWTTVPLKTDATSEIRLSALGTAQLCSEPTKPEVDVPAPLPYELEPVDGSAPAPVDEPVDALVDVTVEGVSGGSTGTFAVGLSELTMLDVDVVVALAVVVADVDDE